MGRVRLIKRLGNESIAYINAEIGEITLRLAGNVQVSNGEDIRVAPRREHVHRFDDNQQRIG